MRESLEFPTDRRIYAQVLSRARGLTLGLALGDALGASGGKAAGQLTGTVTTQLACFTLEGLTRAHVRGQHKGIWHPPSTLWHAYNRWAAMQNLHADQLRRRWQGGTEGTWPDGWLADVPALHQRRGSAPATVATVAGGVMGTPEEPVGHSRGCHAITRTLPVAIYDIQGLLPADQLARDTAATTHGHPDAWSATALGSTIAARLLREGDIHAAFDTVARAPSRHYDRALQGEVRDAAHAGRKGGHPATLRTLAPDATARSALLGAIYCTAAHPEPGDVGEALALACTAPDPDSVAAVTGAFLGASHGAEALPSGPTSQIELAWVVDTLTQDLLRQVKESPSGTDFDPGDQRWWSRYPGW